MSDYAEVRKSLEELRLDFNRRIDALEDKVAESEYKISIHDSKFLSLEESVREIRTTAHKTTAELHRLADALSTQGLVIRRVDENTNKILELLQPKATL